MRKIFYEHTSFGGAPENGPYTKTKDLKDEVVLNVNTLFPALSAIDIVQGKENHRIYVTPETIKILVTDILNHQDELRQMGLVEEA